MRRKFSSKPCKGKYLVAIPIAGSFTVEVDAESEADAVEAAWRAVDDMGTAEKEDALEWEFHECLTEGNVLHPSLNEIEVDFQGDGE